jgi:hypothetical protein
LRNGRHGDEGDIKQLQESLHAEFAALELLSKSIPGISGIGQNPRADPTPSVFDDLDDDDEGIQQQGIQIPHYEGEMVPEADEAVPIQLIPITMPSTLQLPPAHPYCVLELGIRKTQANQHLNALKEVIADKSFQYSHVIRPPTSRAMQSRARSAIGKFNDKISFHCRIYTRC